MFKSRNKLRNKISLFMILIIFPLILAFALSIYILVGNIIEEHINSELNNSTNSLVSFVRTSATLSIKNHLRAIAEYNRDIAHLYYNQYETGKISYNTMMKRISEIFLSQKIGNSGYIYALDSKANVVIHPKKGVLGTNVLEYEFVRKQLSRKEGYLEYLWKNPDEDRKRRKALYMSYYGPLDMIVSVSSYRSEFTDLIHVDDFKRAVLSYKFGNSGYAYVLDKKGNPIIHPVLEGENIRDNPEYNSEFVNDMLEIKNGTLTYTWKNPGESVGRSKLVQFSYIEEYGWYVVSSMYLDEVNQPLIFFRKIFIFTSFLAAIIIISAALIISSSITNPVKNLISNLKKGAVGDYSVRSHYKSNDEMGQLTYYFNSFMDRLEIYHSDLQHEIEEHKMTQKILKESELLFKSIFDESVQFSAVLSRDGKIEKINKTFSKYLEKENDAYNGTYFWDLEFWGNDKSFRNNIRDAVNKASTGEIVNYELDKIDDESKALNMYFSIKPVINENGKILFLIPEGRDITDIKNAESEKRFLEVKLYQSQKMEAIGTLAGGIAHDFNNILTGIFGYCQLAEISVDDPLAVKENLSYIFKGAERASELVKQILTYSRKSNPKRVPIQLKKEIDESMSLINKIIPSNIEVNVDLKTESYILGDGSKIYQLLMNLCSNADRAMDNGGILNIVLQDAELLQEYSFINEKVSPGKYLQLSVQDTGRGISKENIDKIFDPYFTTSKPGKGTGLGLSVVQGVVKEHKGYLQVESKEGEGTIFKIYFPLLENIEEYENNKKIKTQDLYGNESILVVDDEKEICDSYKKYFEVFGYSVETASSAEEGMQFFKKNNYNLLITDMTMSGLSGCELASFVKENYNIPVILCTGYSENIDSEKAASIGIDKFMLKPVSLPELLLYSRMLLDGDTP